MKNVMIIKLCVQLFSFFFFLDLNGIFYENIFTSDIKDDITFQQRGAVQIIRVRCVVNSMLTRAVWGNILPATPRWPASWHPASGCGPALSALLCSLMKMVSFFQFVHYLGCNSRYNYFYILIQKYISIYWNIQAS